MTDAQWQRAFDLYEAAAGLTPDRAGEKLHSLSDDPEVIHEVAAMLTSLHRDQPAVEDHSPASKSGLRIGRYEVMELLGCGATGDVYRGHDSELGRPVALKFMTVEYAAADSAARRFLREAQAASALNHPNIVTVHEVISWESFPVIVMELVDGVSLRTLCRQPLPIPEVIRCGSQILQALAAAHANGIVHRDLKPENVIVRPDGYLKVLDFGLARQVELTAGQGLTSTLGLPVGTLRYMSPEQCRGESATPASDVFAAGVVLYEMSTGKHPFGLDSPLDTAHAIVWNEPVVPASAGARIPAALSSLILRLLAKKPADRPDAAQALRELTGAAEKPAVRRLRPSPVLVGLAVAAMGAAGFAIWRSARSAPRALTGFEQITWQSAEDYVTASAISPDGESLAFADLDGMVHWRDLEGTTDRPLRRFPGGRIDSIFWIAARGPLLVSERDLSEDRYLYRIWTLDPASGEAKLLPVSGRKAVSSHDGKSIAYLSPNGAEIWVADVAGDKPRRLAVSAIAGAFKFFVWSPDNRLILYWTVEEGRRHRSEWHHSKMFAVDAVTGKLILEEAGGPLVSPFMLPDGRLLYSTLPPRLVEVRTDPATGHFVSPPRPLTDIEPGLDKDVTASSDGRRIAAGFHRSFGPYVYVGDLQPGNARLINSRRLTLEDTTDFPHAWTPGNAAVLFESARRGNYDLFVHRIGQRNAEALVAMPLSQVYPMVSPDGRWVLFLSGPVTQAQAGTAGGKRTWNLMKVSIGGGVPEAVPTGGPVQEFGCLYKASRCVLRELDNGQAVFYDLDPVKGKGRELARIATGPTVFGDWDLSPDGTMVAMTNVYKLPATIRIVYLGGPARETEIRLDGPPPVGKATWTADGRGWYVALDDSQMRLIDWNGRSRFVHDVGYWVVPSTDGKRLAFLDVPRDQNVRLLRR